MMTQTSSSCQHLTFGLGDNTYALEISQVREVVDFSQITRVPGLPQFARGIINLREKTVPVFDLNLKFHHKGINPETFTCIVIAQVPSGGRENDGDGLIGILANKVYEVCFLEPEPAASIETMTATSTVSRYIKGISRQASGFILALSLEALFTRDEIKAASGAVAA